MAYGIGKFNTLFNFRPKLIQIQGKEKISYIDQDIKKLQNHRRPPLTQLWYFQAAFVPAV
ncbi:MAG: hypothetical protein JWR02_545 [Mucilaginibacter sp.]|nr:hypothetical protein [Mucilaginibacter sp.]